MTELPRIEASDPDQALSACRSLLALVENIADKGAARRRGGGGGVHRPAMPGCGRTRDGHAALRFADTGSRPLGSMSD